MNPPHAATKEVIDRSMLTPPGSRPVFRPASRPRSNGHPYSQPTSGHSPPLAMMPIVINTTSGGPPAAPVRSTTDQNTISAKDRDRLPITPRANPFQKTLSPPIAQVNPEPPTPAQSSAPLPSVEVVVETPPSPSFQSTADPQRKPKMYERVVDLALSPNAATGPRKLRPPPLSEHPNTTCLCKGTVRQPRMIQCDCCIKWYHLSCVHLTIWRSRLLRTFLCPPCDRWIHAHTRFDTSRFRRKRQLIVFESDDDKGPANHAPLTSAIATPVLKRKRASKSPTTSDDEFTDSDQARTLATKPLQRKPRRRPKATKATQPSGPPSATKRMSTRVRILNVFVKILTEAAALTADPSSITATQIESLAIQIEEEAFQQLGVKVGGQIRSCGPRYAAKCRSLRYNLTDPNNPGPRNGLFSGRITPQALVSLSPEALAPEQIRMLAQEVKQRSLRESTITEKSAPRMIKKSHKGEIELIPTFFAALEPDTAAMRLEQTQGQPSHHRGNENLDDDTLRLSEYLKWKDDRHKPSTEPAGDQDADRSFAQHPLFSTVAGPQVVIPSVPDLPGPALSKLSRTVPITVLKPSAASQPITNASSSLLSRQSTPSTCGRSARSTARMPVRTTPRRKQGNVCNGGERTTNHDEDGDDFWLGTSSYSDIGSQPGCATSSPEQVPLRANAQGPGSPPAPSLLSTPHQLKPLSSEPFLTTLPTKSPTPQPSTFAPHYLDHPPPPPAHGRPPCHYQPQHPQVSASRIVKASTPWHGVMALPSGVQFRGKGYHMYDDAWNTQPRVDLTDLIPSHLFIDNKSQSAIVTDYLYKYRYETSRPIVLIRFELDDRADSGTDKCRNSSVPAEPTLSKHSQAQQDGVKNFAAFIGYFQQRQAIGVATMTRPGVKRLYVVPLQASDAIPDVLSWFPEVVLSKRDHDYLFALLTLSDFTHVSMTADDPEPVHPSPIQPQANITVGSPMLPSMIDSPMTMMTPYMGLAPDQTNGAMQQQLVLLSVLLAQNPAALSLVVALSAMAANPTTNQLELAQALQVLLQAASISAAVGGNGTGQEMSNASEDLTHGAFGLANEGAPPATMVELTDGISATSPAPVSSISAPMPPPPPPSLQSQETEPLGTPTVPKDQANSPDSIPQTLFGYFKSPLPERYGSKKQARESTALANEASASLPHQASHSPKLANGPVDANGLQSRQRETRADASGHDGSRSPRHEPHQSLSDMSIEDAPEPGSGPISSWESDATMLEAAFVPSWGDK